MLILVVDENTRHGLSVKSCLKNWGCTVEAVPSAAAGTARLLDRIPDAVFIDVQTKNWHDLLDTIDTRSLMTTVVAMADESCSGLRKAKRAPVWACLSPTRSSKNMAAGLPSNRSRRHTRPFMSTCRKRSKFKGFY